jgi:transcriptional regulator with GAF, ATPase, and Fis domain
MRGVRDVHGSASSRFYVQLFPHDGADGIARLIVTLRERKVLFVQEWHRLCASSLGAHRALSKELFQETYVPSLRSAAECLARGDAAGFVSFAGGLGERLARAGIPFAAFVAHIAYLKESCAKTLADDPVQMSTALLILDKLMCCLLSAAADAFHAELKRMPATPETATPWAPPFEHPVSVPASGFFHGIVGRSPAMQRVFEQIKRVAPGPAPVLVLGETGTGKEMVARAIHQCGPRRTGPFIALNCAALPRDLIESELFGYRRGAFSGAIADCIGLFRAAAGGTLLLDEITEMGPYLQAKLLRVLQERTVRPVGSVSEEAVDVRIIASTNRDPAAALRSRLLRSDLYYRLSVSTIVLPPLRERADDVAPLVEYQLCALNERSTDAGTGLRGITSDAMQILQGQAWLGNVRELFNVVENAFTMCQARNIGVENLGFPPSGKPETVPVEDAPVVPPTFAQSERTLIERALAFTGGNKLRAAQQLGISRKKLYAKLARYGRPAGPGH